MLSPVTAESVKPNAKPREKQIAGICAAAKSLGVHRGHLWAVLKGKRESKSLLTRFQELRAAQNSKRAIPMPPDLAAPENFRPSFFNRLAKLKLELVIVMFNADPGSPIWGFPGIERALGDELAAANAGQFDSSIYIPGAQWHLFHVTALGVAVGTLKSGIDARGLLPIATIFHATSNKSLQVWWSPSTTELASVAKLDTEA